ncbi:MAG: hypothetical protein IPK00_10380 [Deltaproteobacteria bacterium]|nr:hypothetical protein [Deltaproteobacteria bacterium]
MYEHRSDALLPLREFALRVVRQIFIAAFVAGGALAIGAVGYHCLADLPWVDSILNAAMILGGMGPVDLLHSNAAKLFAAGYALFSGIVFIGVAGLILAPLFHRVLHRFHLELEEFDDPRRDD